MITRFGGWYTMFKYFFIFLVLAGLIFGGFQNCSDSEFSSNSATGKPTIKPPIVDPPIEAQSFNLGDYPTGDICVQVDEQKIFKIDVITILFLWIFFRSFVDNVC